MLTIKIAVRKINPTTTFAIARLSNTCANLDTAEVKPFSAIPGPRSLPIINSGWAFFPVIGKYDHMNVNTLSELRRDYGDIVKLEMPTRKTVLLFNPVHFQRIFSEESNTPARPGLLALRKYRKSKPEVYPTLGLVVLQGAEWRELRSKLQKHLMNPSTIRMFLEPIGLVAEDLVHRIKRIKNEKNEVDNFLNEVFKWALESVGVFSLNRRFGCLEDNLAPDSEPQSLINATNRTLEALHKLENGFELFRYFPMPAYKKLAKAQTYYESVALKYVKQSLEDLKEQKDETGLNLMDSLLSDPAFDTKQVIAAVMDMILAGIDTSTISVSFSLYELAIYPEKQEKLYEEFCRLMPDKNQPLTAEIFEKMEYLHACVREAMRLHPATVGTARYFDREIVIDGYQIPPMTQIGLMLRDSSRREEYFKDADKFIPERWLTSRNELPMPYASMPFSYGPRMCVGRRFAEQEVKVFLLKMIRNFRVEYHHEPIETFMGTVLLPNKPLRFEFYSRD